MSRIVVIGATGHVGTYLVPRLVRGGHEVRGAQPGRARALLPAPEWRAVERVTADREAEDAAGAFGERIAALAPDAVVDMLCFTPESAQQLAGRAAAGPAAAAALRHHLGPRPGRAGAGHRGRAAHRLRRVRDRQGGDRGAAAPRDARRRRAERRAASRAHQRPVARPSRRRATSISTSGGAWPPASRSPCRTSGSACCTTCTPTTSRRPSSARSPARPRSGRASTSCPSRR